MRRPVAGLPHVVVMLGEAVDLQAGEGVGRPWCLANLNGEEAALGFCSKRTKGKVASRAKCGPWEGNQKEKTRVGPQGGKKGEKDRGK